jgi:signal transduction histidine kinase
MIPHSLILHSEDSSTLTNLISKFEYTYEIAESLSSIKEFLAKEKFHILFIDIEKNSTTELHSALNEVIRNFPDLMILVITTETLWDKTAQFLKQHQAYDFIQKPLDKDKLKFSIDRSFDYLQLKLKSSAVLQGENALYKRMIEIFDWKKSLVDKESENIAGDIIHQMNISLFQGSGIGTLMSVVSILLNKSKLDESGKNFITPKPVIELLQENYDSAKGMFDSMSVSQSVIDDTSEINDFSTATSFGELVEEEVSLLQEALKIKNQKVTLSSIPTSAKSKYMRFSKDKLTYTVREVILNAIKYSKESDTIYILYFHKENFLEFKIINPAITNDDGSVGISGKYETLVFEPFFRISSIVDDSYAKYELFRFGLGLPLVRKIIDLHKANVQIYSIENNIRKEKSTDVCLTIRFPLNDTEK